MRKQLPFDLALLAAMMAMFSCSAPKDGDSSPVIGAVPSTRLLQQSFSEKDEENFRNPPKAFYPETWFHYVSGNVDMEDITKDLEAISQAGIAGVQFFHGMSGEDWPGTKTHIECLSPEWESLVSHTATQAQRLGLRFTVQNCPGWAMSGGPWIQPEKAMRHLSYSRTDVSGGGTISLDLPTDESALEEGRDYRDIAVLAFPTPMGDTGKPLIPGKVTASEYQREFEAFLRGEKASRITLDPATREAPHTIEVTFDRPTAVRTIVFPAINTFFHNYCAEPGVWVEMQAILEGGSVQKVLSSDMPMSNWQDYETMSFALDEVPQARSYRILIANEHEMSLSSLSLLGAARKNSWESEAGWTLRQIERSQEHPRQDVRSYVQRKDILDITESMDKDGHLEWQAPRGEWTILRIGHVNTLMKNSPAPLEATGWECDKLSAESADIHFDNYVGRLSQGVLKGKISNMLMDSWECKTQTWTPKMEEEFSRLSGYDLRLYLPAILGYVLDDQETTARFLLDWRNVLNDLMVNNYYGRMAQRAHENGLTISYETAAGDIFPTDILEYYKWADVPMTEFWQPLSHFLSSHNFKPIRPTASAARLYGKPRISAESFTSFDLTWDEHPGDLREVANLNIVEGVTHFVFHTYTHNPGADEYTPGTSFGQNIGSPMLRTQTWWRHMPQMTAALARTSYLLERGHSVSDVLWYLGDEMNHKPDQYFAFPEGYRYDYCNPDILLHRLSVKDGLIVTPEGQQYRALWLRDNERMRPETLEKIILLVEDGATIIGRAPRGLATLSDAARAQERLDSAVSILWGQEESGTRHVGKGKVIITDDLAGALEDLTRKDVQGDRHALWIHRKASGADWYFVCPRQGQALHETLMFRAEKALEAELWNPSTGEIRTAEASYQDGYISLRLDLERGEGCFVVLRSDMKPRKAAIWTSAGVLDLTREGWQVAFPEGWGAPQSVRIQELAPIRDLDLGSQEASAFSGTATWSTSFRSERPGKDERVILDLGRVEMIARVRVNGTLMGTRFAEPYRLDITGAMRDGDNDLTIEVTSSWFNRLAYDASLREDERKTWTIHGPEEGSPLRDSGLIGPVRVRLEKQVQ